MGNWEFFTIVSILFLGILGFASDVFAQQNQPPGNIGGGQLDEIKQLLLEQSNPYKISVDIDQRSRAVAVLANCDNVPDSQCVFSVTNIQYFKRSGLLKTHVFALCFDNVNFDENFVSNCSKLKQTDMGGGFDGSVAIGVGVDVGLSGGGEATVGGSIEEGVSGGLSMPLVRGVIVPSYLIPPEGKMGGNILLESGIGEITAGKLVMVAHARFMDGKITFMGEKPGLMELTIGYKPRSGVPICFDIDGNPIDPCPDDLSVALNNGCFGGCSILNQASYFPQKTANESTIQLVGFEGTSKENSPKLIQENEDPEFIPFIQPDLDPSEIKAAILDQKGFIQNSMSAIRTTSIEEISPVENLSDNLKDFEGQGGLSATKDHVKEILPTELPNIIELLEEATGKKIFSEEFVTATTVNGVISDVNEQIMSLKGWALGFDVPIDDPSITVTTGITCDLNLLDGFSGCSLKKETKDIEIPDPFIDKGKPLDFLSTIEPIP